MDNKKVIVTGGAGFIGSHFVNKYLHRCDLHVIDSLTYASNLNNLSNLFGSDRLYEVDIADTEKVFSIFENIRPDIVINFAAESHVDNSISTPAIFTKTNVVGTQTLLDASLKYGVQKFVQVSTDEVYGHLTSISENSFTEKTPLNPRSPYSATKASADLLVKSYVNTFGLDASITRCSNNFGENQHEEKLIPKIVKNAMNNLPIPIYGSGLNIRDWIYVEDHIDGIFSVIQNGKPGEVYNFGGKRGESEITNIDLCKRILSIMGRDESLITRVEDRKGHDFRYSVDYSKSEKELSWKPLHSLNNKLDQVINSILNRFEKTK